MIIAWIGYCLLVSALLGLAALATERALGHYRRPVRAVWTAAIAGSVVLPIAAYVAPTLVARFAAVSPVLPTGLSPTMTLPSLSSVAAQGFDWDAFLVSAGLAMGIVWILSIVGLGAHLFVTHRRLRREMQDWTPGEILEAPVLMSPNRGPAVVGIRKGVIVMPAWISELEEDVLRLVFLHETEHQRAGDHTLFSLGLLGVLFMPWNPFAWWQLRRLRLAIEFDCDRRVMARGVEPREYAEALLTVGGRLTAPPLAAAAFAERKPAVERRLRRMTEPLRRLRGPRATLGVGVGTLAVLFACNSPLPTDTPVDAPADLESSVTFGEVQTKDAAKRKLATEADASAPTAGPDPLIVIDGVIQAGEFDKRHLETLDIESVEVIKGAAAETLYGARARDGVVQITTEAGATATAGADPGGSVSSKPTEAASRVRLRSTTPDESARPLIVVDGVVQSPDATLSDLEELDIDLMEVVKGAAAYELYGDRGENGVVLITTKDSGG